MDEKHHKTIHTSLKECFFFVFKIRFIDFTKPFCLLDGLYIFFIILKWKKIVKRKFGKKITKGVHTFRMKCVK